MLSTSKQVKHARKIIHLLLTSSVLRYTDVDTMNTTGVMAHTGAAPLGMTVVEGVKSLVSCMMVEGIELSVQTRQ